MFNVQNLERNECAVRCMHLRNVHTNWLEVFWHLTFTQTICWTYSSVQYTIVNSHFLSFTRWIFVASASVSAHFNMYAECWMLDVQCAWNFINGNYSKVFSLLFIVCCMSMAPLFFSSPCSIWCLYYHLNRLWFLCR